MNELKKIFPFVIIEFQNYIEYFTIYINRIKIGYYNPTSNAWITKSTLLDFLEYINYLYNKLLRSTCFFK